MHKRLIAFGALAAMAAASALPTPSLAQDRTKVGTLNCDVSAGIGFEVQTRWLAVCGKRRNERETAACTQENK